MLSGISCDVDAATELVSESCTDAPAGGIPKCIQVLIASETSVADAMPIYRPETAAFLTSVGTAVGSATIDLHSFVSVEFLHDLILLFI